MPENQASQSFLNSISYPNVEITDNSVVFRCFPVSTDSYSSYNNASLLLTDDSDIIDFHFLVEQSFSSASNNNILFELENNNAGIKVSNGVVLLPKSQFFQGESLRDTLIFIFKNTSTNPHTINVRRLQYLNESQTVTIGSNTLDHWKYYILDTGTSYDSTLRSAGELVFIPRNNSEFNAALDYYFPDISYNQNLTRLTNSQILLRKKAPFCDVDSINYFEATPGQDNSGNLIINEWQLFEQGYQITDMSYAFSNYSPSSPQIPDISRNMRKLFNIDIKNWNTTNVVNFDSMFKGNEHFNIDISTPTTYSSKKKVFSYDRSELIIDTSSNGITTSSPTAYVRIFGGATIGKDYYVTKISVPFQNGLIIGSPPYSAYASNCIIQIFECASGTTPDNGGTVIYDSGELKKKPLVSIDLVNPKKITPSNSTDLFLRIKGPAGGPPGSGAFSWFHQPFTSPKEYSYAFEYYTLENISQPWVVNNSVNMTSMFEDATSFDKNIRSWSVSNTDTTTKMFNGSSILTNAIYRFIPNGWVNLSEGTPNNSIFFSNVAATPPFIPLSNSDFIQGLNYYFDSGTTQPLPPSSTYATASSVGKQSDSTTKAAIEKWYTVNVTDMTNAFQNKTTFNQDLSGWVVEQVEKMQGMFLGASSFNNGETGNTMSNPLDWSLNSLHDTIATTPYALQGMFQGASSFNQRLGCSNWDVSNCSTFSYMFDGCNKLSDEALVGINTWNTQNVRDIRNMFTNCNDPSFVSPGLSYWNTNYLDSGNGLIQVFEGATYFNENLSTKVSPDGNYIAWNTANVTKFPETFKNALSFNNGDISGGSDASLNWYINGSLSSMFEGASSFNQDVRTENVILSVDNPLVSTIVSINDATAVVGTTIEGPVSPTDYQQADVFGLVVPGSDYLTRITLAFNNDYIGENATLKLFINTVTGNVPNWQELTQYATSFVKENITEIIFDKPANGSSPLPSVPFDIRIRVFNPNGWLLKQGDATINTPNPNILCYKIDTLKSYNNYQAWNVSNTQDFGSMFKNAAIFNRPLYSWNTESALNMSHMFDGASSFNQDLNTLNYPDTGSYTSWKMNTVTDIKFMFKDASNFDNGDNQTFAWILDSISGDSIRGLFKGASSFNKNLNSFPQSNTSSNSWDLSGVTHFNEVFAGASSFNNGIPNVGITTDFIASFNWETGRAVDMSGMFQDATMFTQNVNYWFGSRKLEDMSNAQVSGSTNGLRGMFSGATKFVADARSWYIPDNIDFTDIFKGATDMSSIYYLRRNETGYDDTPDINFFNYSNQVVVKNISYQNYYDSSLALTVIPASVNNIENGQVRLPYNLLFATQQNVTVADGLTFNMAANADSLDVVSDVNVDVFYTPIYDNEKIFLESTIDFIWKNNVLISIPLQVYVDYGLVIPPTPPDPIPDPDVTPPPPQKSGREYACSNKKRHGCEAYMANSDKNGGLFSGNINQPNFMAVEAYKYSNLVNFSSRRQSMKTKYIPLQLNVFGKYQGAPGGSGMRLKNKF